MQKELFIQLEQAIARHAHIALVCHRRPDGDAISSLLACDAYVRSLGKRSMRYCVDATPRYLEFLLHTEAIQHAVDDFWHSATAVMVLDCGDLSLTALPKESFAGKEMIMIDHHASNNGYGDVRLLLPAVSSTAEILYSFFTHTRFAIDARVATQLLTGIYTDTDAFSNLGTTPESLRVSAELLKRGADFRDITAYTMHNKTITSLKLWGRALERLRVDAQKGIATTVIFESDIAECKAMPEDAEGVANLLNHLSDVKMSMVLREEPGGMVKGSLRTTHDSVDVSKIAKLMGGGGHTKAAGFSVKGRIVEDGGRWKIVENNQP